MWIIYIAVILISLYYTINNKNSRIANLVLIFFLALLAASPRVGYDTNSFQVIFSDYASNREPLATWYNQALIPYLFLMRFGYAIGLHNLYVFKFVTVFVLLFFVELRSKKFTSNFSIWIFFYSCSLFVLDAIQFRNYIALSLMMIAFSYLVEGGVRNDAKFCFFMMLATIIHITFIVYFSLLIAKHAGSFIDRYAKKFFNICMMIIGTCYFVRPVLAAATALLLSFLSDYYASFFADQARLGYVIMIAEYIPLIILLFYIRDRYNIAADKSAKTERNVMEHSIVLNEMVMLFPLMILCLYSVSIERFLRNLVVLCLFSVCNYIQDCQNYLERRNIKIILFLICVYIFVYQNYLTGPASDIVWAVLKGKLFFIGE